MAKFRTLLTSFWDEPYVGSLPVEVRYLYLYLRVNKHIQASGCFRIELPQISVETGLSMDQVRGGVKHLEADEKVKYGDGWMAVRDAVEGVSGAKVQLAVDQQLAEAPRWVGEFLLTGGKHKDERAMHPAIAACRALAERYPLKRDWDHIIEILGDDFDVDRLCDAHAYWARNGWRPDNWTGILDYYVRGVPRERQTNTQILRSYNN
jgi:hypothetical protein